MVSCGIYKTEGIKGSSVVGVEYMILSSLGTKKSYINPLGTIYTSAVDL